MKNYQLYKTNVLLSGQMKWDIVIGNSNGTLYVKDFHITPVSNYVPYNKYSDDNIINYEHRYNIKDLYNKIKGYFYSTPVNKHINNDWPIVSENNKYILPYDDTYFSGCSRMEYGVYNKPFNYFCPVWFEHLADSDQIGFEMTIYSGGSMISNKILKLEEKSGSQYEYHNKFVNYINNYLKYVNILSEHGCDDIININLSKKEAYLKGVDVTTGNIIISNISNIVNNLLSRERPLLEFDTFITESFKNTKTITPNLFNFNLCFDFDDILSNSISDRIAGNQLNIDVNIGIFKDEDFNRLDKYDIYTNYDFIPRKFCKDLYKFDDRNNVIESTPELQEIPNVLDYLKDNKYVEFINKNKYVQKICHWQLTSNDDYIFNLYDGFGGYVERKNEDGTIEHRLISHQYADSPELYQYKYDRELNNAGWTACFEINSASYWYIIGNYQRLINDNYIPSFGDNWNSNIKYNYKKDPIYIFTGYVTDDLDLKKLDNEVTTVYIENSLIHVLGENSNVIFICSKDMNNLTLAGVLRISLYSQMTSGILTEIGNNVYNYSPAIGAFGYIENEGTINAILGSYIQSNTLFISKLDDNNQAIKALAKVYEVINTIKDIPLVILKNSLHIVKTDSPSLSTDEIEYYKNNNYRNYLIRYDGKIKPCFGYGDNYIYYKVFTDGDDDITKNIMKSISKYSDSGYPPIFKSINYCSYVSEKINYNEPLNIIKDNIEYKWFGINKYIHLPPSIEFNVLSDTDSLNDINNVIIEKLKSKFNIILDENYEIEYYNYILNLYNIKYDLLSIDGKSNFLYDIKLTLK